MPKNKLSHNDFIFINKTSYKFSKIFFRKAVDAVLKAMSLKKMPEFSLVLLSEPDIKKINKEYRKKNKPTSVLAFPSKDFKKIKNFEERQAGDIFLCPDYIKKEAKKTKETLNYRLTVLFIHGILHLLGFDHKENKDALKMEALERKVLRKF